MGDSKVPLVSLTRLAIERAFDLLKGCFRRLKYVDIDRLKDLPYIILASYILHNVCIMSDKDIDDFLDNNYDVAADNAEGWDGGGGDGRLAENDATVHIGDLKGHAHDSAHACPSLV